MSRTPSTRRTRRRTQVGTRGQRRRRRTVVRGQPRWIPEQTVERSPVEDLSDNDIVRNAYRELGWAEDEIDREMRELYGAKKKRKKSKKKGKSKGKKKGKKKTQRRIRGGMDAGWEIDDSSFDLDDSSFDFLPEMEDTAPLLSGQQDEPDDVSGNWRGLAGGATIGAAAGGVFAGFPGAAVGAAVGGATGKPVQKKMKKIKSAIKKKRERGQRPVGRRTSFSDTSQVATHRGAWIGGPKGLQVQTSQTSGEQPRISKQRMSDEIVRIMKIGPIDKTTDRSSLRLDDTKSEESEESDLHHEIYKNLKIALWSGQDHKLPQGIPNTDLKIQNSVQYQRLGDIVIQCERNAVHRGLRHMLGDMLMDQGWYHAPLERTTAKSDTGVFEPGML